MSTTISNFKQQYRLTFKSSDTEEWWDKVFTRPVGYLFALIAKRLKITPNTITIISIIIGVLGSHLLYYNELWVVALGCFIIFFGNILDSTDGQLARMTNQCSPLGRFLDGIGGDIIFGSVYIHLILKIYFAGSSPWIIVLFLAAAWLHAYQAALSDYFRNAHLFFIGKKNELSDSEKSERDYQNSKGDSLITRTWLNIYRYYARQQEAMTPNFKKLLAFVKANYNDAIPDDIRKNFRSYSKPLLKYGNVLTTNTRLGVLFLLVLIDKPLLYPIFELTVMNILFFYMMFKHNYKSRKLLESLKLNQLSPAANEA